MVDYISTPRPNHYQSLHTTIIGPQKQMIGLMIRTGEMHLLAELGVVSLWQGELEYPWRSAHEYHSGWINSLRGVAEAAVERATAGHKAAGAAATRAGACATAVKVQRARARAFLLM